MKKDVISYDSISKYTVVVEKVGRYYQVEVRLGIPGTVVHTVIVQDAEYARQLGLDYVKQVEWVKK